MKTATLPPLRVEPALKRSVKNALREGETISSFIESSVRTMVERRASQEGFLRRGLAAEAEAEASGAWVPAAAVVGKLKVILSRAKKTAERSRARRAR